MIGETFGLAIDGGCVLPADLGLPDGARGLAVFAQRTGRSSAHNRAAASSLMARGLGALVFDLMTTEEAEGDAPRGALRVDIGFLGRRLVSCLDAVKRHAALRHLPIGIVGADTGAAAALVAAAWRPALVGAVVTRGGCPELATPVLKNVRAPVLVVVGGRDLAVVRTSHALLPRLPSPSRMLLVPGAGPQLDDTSATSALARAASTWFLRHLPAALPAVGFAAPDGRR